ncbi:DDE domain protein [Candidatus Methanoperedenaceae archaeon GB50]|nr:DDE domain protein [Candidatus Methanoperedenaceae archaeon GB50]CAD7773675.1 DDE domain protein [Candidatus Methanoperedenaceae archaeon GB50]
MPVVSEKKRRYSIALDETVVKSNKKAYYVYSAVDVEKNELILMRVYTNRNYLVSRSFLKEVLKFCENKPRFIVDKAPWLIDALKSLDLEFEHQTFRREKPG